MGGSPNQHRAPYFHRSSFAFRISFFSIWPVKSPASPLSSARRSAARRRHVGLLVGARARNAYGPQIASNTTRRMISLPKLILPPARPMNILSSLASNFMSPVHGNLKNRLLQSARQLVIQTKNVCLSATTRELSPVLHLAWVCATTASSVTTRKLVLTNLQIIRGVVLRKWLQKRMPRPMHSLCRFP